MRHEERSWTTFDGIPVYAQSWAPDGPPRAAIALVHGLGEHSGRYPRLVELLTTAGFAVNGFDGRGHGKSGGPRLYAPSFDELMKDIDRHIDLTRQLFPGVPLFIYGHSFGGEQALYYGLSRAPAVAGVVASSPGLAPAERQPPYKLLAARVVSRIAPTMHFSFGPQADALSRDPAWVQTTAADPLFQAGVSARLGLHILRAGEWVRGHRSFPAPLLVMQGTDDQIVDAHVNIAFAKSLQGDVTIKVWDGMRHELHNELGKDEVIAFARGWLEKHIT